MIFSEGGHFSSEDLENQDALYGSFFSKELCFKS